MWGDWEECIHIFIRRGFKYIYHSKMDNPKDEFGRLGNFIICFVNSFEVEKYYK